MGDAVTDQPNSSAGSRQRDILPSSLPPRGLNRVEASAYIGISPTKFDQMVTDGRMPQPKSIDGRVVWDRLRLDQAFAALPDRRGVRDEDDGWDHPSV